MISPRPFNLYLFGTGAHPLGGLVADSAFRDNSEHVRLFTDLNYMAEWFGIDEFTKKYLPSSTKKLAQISRHIKENFTERAQDKGGMPESIDADAVTYFKTTIQEFETLLEDELSKLPIFCCEDDRIGNFSFQKLMKGASNGYAPKTKSRLTPECIREIDESGKCLIYELSTASGFHVLRSVELTIRQYLLSIPGFTLPPLNRQNWGEYLQLLKDNGAGRTVTDHLYNIKDNYRNPLMHPQDSIEMDEAVSLFAVSQSMNEMMIADMVKRKLIP
ncbi:MAG: hypothetical protein WCC87_19950 [Candidatus Korobacteraceae bacterium]